MALSKVNPNFVSQNLGRRNLVINGGMQVAQRGDTTGLQSGYGGVDRFHLYGNTAARATLKQGGTDATGVVPHKHTLEIDCTTADASVATGDYHYLGHRFEGQSLQHIRKGTANAQSVTLSFWVSSPKTGIHIIQLYDNDNARHISKSYTVNSANTFEKKTLTFAGDTSGALGDDTNYSLQIYWWLLAGSDYTSGTLTTSWSAWTAVNAAVGQVNVFDSTSNNFYLTGVQLEVGSFATDFEHRSYSEDLLLCQRYFQQLIGTSDAFTFPAKGQGSTTIDGTFPLAVPLRGSPTMNAISTRFFSDDGFSSSTATPTALQFDARNFHLAVNIGSFSGGTSFANNHAGVWCPTSSVLKIDAEI